jgi:4-phospho-D-threonate 3-dehydrogenase / 4-phospho-D-erythronate 3-dehydrogenase
VRDAVATCRPTSVAPAQAPRLALTIGDVAGVGPEVVVRSLVTLLPERDWRTVIVGCPIVVRRVLALHSIPWDVVSIQQCGEDWSRAGRLVVWNPSRSSVEDVPVGVANARAGRAAYDWLVAATGAALAGQIDAIVTAPLSKLGLHRAAIHFPGHTEILAAECGVPEVAMMLYLPPGEPLAPGHSLSIAHATLHTSIASVPGLLTTQRVRDTILLIDGFLKRFGDTPRIGVCALNPHAGEEGLFGHEEERVIAPAVAEACHLGIHVVGPRPADTLIKSAVEGAFNGVVAMYHDQGHIALKLIGFHRAVNVTLGLPIVRTSPSQGTAYDIAWTGNAVPSGMISAIETAVRLI